MAATAFRTFQNGFRTIDGTKLNNLFQANMSFSATLVGGSIDGMVVGGTTPAAATVTNLSITGSQKVTATTVAAAGATQGNATAIPAGKSVVFVTVTASTEGVKLPTAATGLQIDIYASPTVGVKVYAAAAGQKIGTATTATTAYGPVVKNTSTTFIAKDTTQWFVSGKAS